MNPEEDNPQIEAVKFTNNVKECISLSREEAIALGHNLISTEHLMLGLLIQKDNSAVDTLNRAGINTNALYTKLKNSIRNIYPVSDEPKRGSIPLTTKSEKVLKVVYLESRIFKSQDIKTVHILLSILRDEEAYGYQTYTSLGLSYELIRQTLDVYNPESDKNFDSILSEEQLATAQLIRLIGNPDITIADHIEPAIGIQSIAEEISRLINNLKSSDQAKMIGIFGSWGRGKSFLMNLIWQDLSANNDIYNRIYFQAWKYQDTQATWAYLYESLSDAYFQNSLKPGFLNFWDRIYKIFKLNKIRNGVLSLILFSLSILGIIVASTLLWTYKPFVFSNRGTQFKGLEIAGFVIPISIALITFIQNQIKNSYNSAINTLNKYYKNTSYSSLLGVQHEIQKEIKYLFKAWFIGKYEHNKIILIVDDIDRCNEDKIIQVIDSLRIMLEDEEISNRIIVLAAVDERLLKLAVSRKYYDFIDKNLATKDGKAQPNIITKQMVQEYLDKLFIAGIKLSKLLPSDKQELFTTFTKGHVLQVEQTSKVNQKNNRKGLEAQAPETLPDTGSKSILASPDNQSEEYLDKKGFLLDQSEYDHIHNLLGVSTNEITPRQIRIFYYRYLLARNLIHKKQTSFNSKAELENVQKLLASILLVKCFEDDTVLNEEYNRVQQASSIDKNQTIIALNNQYYLKRDLILEVFTAADMVIGY